MGGRCAVNVTLPDVLMSCSDQIGDLLLLTEMRRYSVSPVRALEVLIWIENEGTGYYRNSVGSFPLGAETN